MNKEVKKKEGETEEDKRKTRRCGENEAAGQQVVEELDKVTAGKQEGQTGSEEETRNKSDKQMRGGRRKSEHKEGEKKGSSGVGGEG